MRKVICFLLLINSFLGHASNEELFIAANKAYSDQLYVEALESYHAIADEGWQSSALFYNMGNAYYRIGKPGFAILYFEKALLLDPEDKDTQHNLEMANAQIIDVFEIVPEPFISRVWKGLLYLFPAASWAMLGLVLVFIGAFLLVLFLKQKKRTTLLFSLYMICGIAGLILLFLGYERNQLDQNQVYGVLISNNAYVKSEPVSGEDLFIIHEGSKGKIEEVYEEWTKIRTPDGKSGWVLSESMEEI